MTIPKVDPNTAIANMYGYELYANSGNPLVIHRFTIRKTDEKGTKRPEKLIEHFSLFADDAWGSTKVAHVVREELRRHWKEWLEWNDAMREAR